MNKKSIKNSISETFRNVRNLTKKHNNRQKTKDNNREATAQVKEIIDNTPYVTEDQLKDLIKISTFDMSAAKKAELRKDVVKFIHKVLKSKGVFKNLKKLLKEVYVAWQLGKYRFYQRATKKKNRDNAGILFNYLTTNNSKQIDKYIIDNIKKAIIHKNNPVEFNAIIDRLSSIYEKDPTKISYIERKSLGDNYDNFTKNIFNPIKYTKKKNRDNAKTLSNYLNSKNYEKINDYIIDNIKRAIKIHKEHSLLENSEEIKEFYKIIDILRRIHEKDPQKLLSADIMQYFKRNSKHIFDQIFIIIDNPTNPNNRINEI